MEKQLERAVSRHHGFHVYADAVNDNPCMAVNVSDSSTVLQQQIAAASTAAADDAAAAGGISLRAVAPVDVRAHELNLSIDVSPRGSASLLAAVSRRRTSMAEPSSQTQAQTQTILCNVSAQMPHGSLTAIIGGSGSGKTSMLNVMSHRLHGSRLHFSGTTLYNGSDQWQNVRSAYVMQQDVLQPTLTVRETLQYSADLRLPPPTTEAGRRRVVEEVILELGLKECADTRIGSHVHKGCSGGEKRRTSIGVQMLANPSVLFLDEPTTGLDATSAFQLVRTLKNLAQNGRTIIMTIHQPRSEIWGLFDHVVLLARGAPVFTGPAVDCLPYFEGLGYSLPAFVNPAEFLIDIAAVDNRTSQLEEVSAARVQALKDAWRQRESEAAAAVSFSQTHVSDTREPSLSPSLSHSRAPGNFHSQTMAMWRQTRVLTSRTLKVTVRDPMGMAGSLVEAVTMGVLTGWIFFALDGSLSGIRSREGALYIAAALQGYLVLLFETYRLTIDIELFDRERGEGVVDVIPFLASRRFARVFVEDIPVPLLFSVIFYFMAGFRPVASQFFIFFSVILLSQYIAVSFAMLCVAISRDFAGASLIANLGYTLQAMACGYFVQSNSIPIYVRWTKWIAYVFYAFGALCANEFVGHFYDCPVAGGAASPACKEYTGDYIIQSLGIPPNWLVRPVVILLGFAIAFTMGSALVLKFWKTELSISRARASDEDKAVGKEKLFGSSNRNAREICISLAEFSLGIEKYNILKSKKTRLSILKPITTEFQAGILNVIMGPSGSGKTSLLNMMARRFHSTVTTRYRPSGRMLFNGVEASDRVVRSLCSYVCQDDDALLSSLTVRETLRFAAELRLPRWMSKAEKASRAEDVLMKMGLKDCADNLIGNDLVKGISGGEKRRVTIGIQILTDPRILLLDEPTSGLDAFTASSILDVLRGLAEEGRTVVFTIHQPRSDLFRHFGNILLLARGGIPVYSGGGTEMLSYFSTQGHQCSKATNPADFALDLITVDLQHATQEQISRERVIGLIRSWNEKQVEIMHSKESLARSQVSLPAELGSLERKMQSLWVSLPILIRRGIVNFRRQPPLVLARIMQVVGFGIVLALFFADLKHDYYSVQTRVGLIQEIAALYFVGMLQNVSIYPAERDVFYREHDDRAYSVEAFFLQYTLLELPFEIISSLIFAVLADIAPGLPRTPAMFFIMAFNCFCIVNCGESVGILFNTLFRHTGFAVNLTSIILCVAQLMSGAMSIDIPSFLQAFNHLSPIKYAMGNLAPYSLRNVQFTCTDYQRLQNGQCPIETGTEVLRLYKLDKNAGLNVMALGVCVVVYRVVAYLVLKAARTHWRRFWKESHV